MVIDTEGALYNKDSSAVIFIYIPSDGRGTIKMGGRNKRTREFFQLIYICSLFISALYLFFALSESLNAE